VKNRTADIMLAYEVIYRSIPFRYPIPRDSMNQLNVLPICNKNHGIHLISKH